MATAEELPLGLPSSRLPRRRRASAGERSKDRVTSFGMKPQDELVLDALRARYGTTLTGEAIRLALRDAARSQGIDIEALTQEAGAAA